MNYQELLESRYGSAMTKQSLPFGTMYKKMVDGKYNNVIDLRPDLIDSLVFCDAIAVEAEQNKSVTHKRQLHFSLATDSSGLHGINLEQGGYLTFAQLLADNQSIVAMPNFVKNTINNLLELTSFLHEQGIYHVCYSPDNILVRKGDNEVMLLFHGSAYSHVNDQSWLYGESAAFLAPEVLENGVFDARSDIYSIGKFIDFLYQQSEIPFEMKAVIKKATAEDPDKRYQTPEEMMKSISTRQNMRKSVISFVAALLVTAIITGLYFTLVPEREDIEFVKPAPKEAEDDLLDDGFDPTTELGLVEDTAAAHLEEKKMREYQAKAEYIFRKNFTREAERVLSEIYNNERMSASEKSFMAASQSTMQELLQAQAKYGSDAGLTDSRSQLLAGQIIEQVSAKLKAQMKQNENAENE